MSRYINISSLPEAAFVAGAPGAIRAALAGRGRRGAGGGLLRCAHQLRAPKPCMTVCTIAGSRLRQPVWQVRLAPFGLRWLGADGAELAADRGSRAYGFGQRTGATLHAMAREPGDRYFGLGDKTGGLDLHGRRLRTVMTDALGYDPQCACCSGSGFRVRSGSSVLTFG